MKIYVITMGEYSDYRICAVATDPEKADKLAEFFSSKYDSAVVEEYDTDDAPDLTEGNKVIRIRFDEGGSVADIDECCNDSWDSSPYMICNDVIVYVLANSYKDAIKIGAERRAKYLAEKMGL